MSKIAWVTLAKIWCERVNQDVELLEQRYYHDDPIPDGAGQSFKVLGRKCTCGMDCNLIGYSCKWAHTNPNFDPFEQAKPPTSTPPSLV